MEMFASVSALIEDDYPLREKLKGIGAHKRFEEDSLQIIVGKESSAAPNYYLIEYNNSTMETKIHHLGHELGEDSRGLEVNATDPSTALENFQRLGFQEVLQKEVHSEIYRVKGLELKVLTGEDSPKFIEFTKSVESVHEQERFTQQALKVLKELGVSEDSVLEGTALQFLMQLMKQEMEARQEKEELTRAAKTQADKLGIPKEDELTDLTQDEEDNKSLF